MSVCIIHSNAFCVEDITNIENYEKALNSEEKYACHHRLETHTSDGERRKVDISKEELIALGMYYHRPANELIYLTNKEHMSLHHKGKQISEEIRKKMSETRKGVCPSNKGVPLSDEQKKELSEKLKGRLSPFKGKHLSEEQKRHLSEINSGSNHPHYDKHWKLVDGKRVYY